MEFSSLCSICTVCNSTHLKINASNNSSIRITFGTKVYNQHLSVELLFFSILMCSFALIGSWFSYQGELSCNYQRHMVHHINEDYLQCVKAGFFFFFYTFYTFRVCRGSLLLLINSYRVFFFFSVVSQFPAISIEGLPLFKYLHACFRSWIIK